MRLSSGVHIEQFSTIDRGGRSRHHAVFAILLLSCPSSRLHDMHVNGFPLSFLTHQIDLINSLYQADHAPTYGIRFISHPNPVSFSGGRIDLCLFCKITGASASSARHDAEEHAEQLLLQLCGRLQDYVWNIVTDREEFLKLWNPFDWSEANIVEIRRREELVALDTIRESRGLGFARSRTTQTTRSGHPVYYVHPFLPHPGQIERLLRIMLLHNTPLAYTACLKPSVLSKQEEQAMQREIARCEGYQPDPAPNLQRIQEQRANMISQGLLTQMLKLQDAPFLMTVSLASPGPISRTLAAAAGVAVSASVGENPASPYHELSFIQMGGYDVVTPSGREELATARENMRTLSQDAWGKSLAGKGLARMRYLLDGNEAVNAFRFPEDLGSGLVGIAVHSQRMRPMPAELNPEDNKSLRTEGILIGTNTYLGVPQDALLPAPDRLTHAYIVGQTGTGKTTLLKTMFISDMRAGRGCALIDPHGDMFKEVLELIPPDRLEDVVIIDPSDIENPIGMNLLEASTHDERYFVAREMTAIIRRILEDEFSFYSKEFAGPVFYQHMQMNMLLTMSDPERPGTMLQFYEIFQSRDYWKRWLPLKIRDPQLDLWVHTLENADYTVSGRGGEISVGNYVSSKFSDFILDPRLRGMFGQTHSTIDFQKIMNEGKILLINLAKGLLGESNSRFLGLVLMAKIQAEAMKRAKMESSERKPFYLYVDEFQSLSTENFTILLSEARKFGMGLVLANQFISQIKDPRIIQAVFGNVGTFLCFRLGREDSELIEPQYLPYFDRVDLINLPNWHTAVRTSIKGWGLPAFTVQTVLPKAPSNPEVARQARELSGKKYTRPRAEVEAMIANSIKHPETKPEPLKIVIFGASGGVGLEVVRQALEAGHKVTAFVRTPEKLSLVHDNLTVIQGDATEAGAVETAIAGQDAVISTLGPSRPPAPHMLEIATNNILAGMKKHDVSRLIFTTGTVIRTRADRPQWIHRFTGFLLQNLGGAATLDAIASREAIEETYLEWTIVRFPRLTNGELTRKYLAGNWKRNSGTQISRSDGADFILKELVEKDYVRNIPLVSC